ncbi:MAG TPA: hypothetical protein VNE38_01340 [Ktedonobacteraceae bacterium]|nr:hypothetical protein [Ktedonobacteraceae bacterium]
MLSTTGFDRSSLPLFSLSRQQLTHYLDHIWQGYFSDIQRVNFVEIAYCQPWKRRLGLIRLSLDGTKSFIGINALLQVRDVPDYVLFTTIAHELTHYAHGFGSPHPRIFEHPHADNVVQRELVKRGLGELALKCDDWIDKQWFSFYDMQRETGWIGISRSSCSTRYHS